MRTLAVLLAALCVISMTLANNVRRSNMDYEGQGLFEWEQQKQEGNHHGSSNSQSNTENGQWMQHQNQGNTHGSSDYEDPLANNWTDVLPYRTKITQRLENSQQLTNQPEIKKKLMKFLEDKLHVCRTPSAGKNKVDRHCMGRLTGQMMQMIAAFENGVRDMPTSYDW